VCSWRLGAWGKRSAFINDAPALHAADVGISVDSGADVAKAAAEIVLLDKDLAILHAGIVEGRHTVVNVGKYILMASSANFGNIMSMALAALLLPFLPLLPIQVLLTNLLYDAAQIGLPFDRVDRDAIERPVHWNIRLIERFMLVMGPVSTLFDLVTFAVLIFIFQVDETLFRTGWFVESLVTQLLMVFAVTRISVDIGAPPFLYRAVYSDAPRVRLVTRACLIGTLQCKRARNDPTRLPHEVLSGPLSRRPVSRQSAIAPLIYLNVIDPHQGTNLEGQHTSTGKCTRTY
jgi:hypothetical protein